MKALNASVRLWMVRRSVQLVHFEQLADFAEEIGMELRPLSIRIRAGVPQRENTWSTSTYATDGAMWFLTRNASAHLEKTSTTVIIYSLPRADLGCGPVMSIEIISRGNRCRTASKASAWVRALDDTVRTVDSASVLSQLDVSSLASRPSGGLVPQSCVDRDDLPSFHCERS